MLLPFESDTPSAAPPFDAAAASALLLPCFAEGELADEDEADDDEDDDEEDDEGMTSRSGLTSSYWCERARKRSYRDVSALSTL